MSDSYFLSSESEDHLQQQLQSLREQQSSLTASGQGDGVQAQALVREIIAVAGRLGFEVDEAAEIADQIDAPAYGPENVMIGEYKVLRGATEPILSFSLIVIAGVIIQLGQPTAGVGLIVAVLTSWVIRGARRIGRLRIDASGGLSFPGHLERIDAAELLSIDFAYPHPWWVSARAHRIGYYPMVDLRLRLRCSRSIQLARGPMWRIQPRREPMAYWQIERFLKALARDAGMTVERCAAGWTAHR